MTLPNYRASRVLSAIRRGSSLPVVVQTSSGRFVAKLRGAAQGVLPLVAEIIAAELATLLGLSVPERALVDFGDGIPSDDANDELSDLLAKSHGENLGFRFLEGARDPKPEELLTLNPEVAARILWLDGLIMNPDRTPRNPNILLWHGQPWLIDHGAALPFHFDWRGVSEQSPRDASFDVRGHVLSFAADRLDDVDGHIAPDLTREALWSACRGVPAAFLDEASRGDDPERTRAAYVAFLWKRLRSPRPFVPQPSRTA
ncbi:MAG: HipA family kinase [Polyangiaceae bacterium]